MRFKYKTEVSGNVSFSLYEVNQMRASIKKRMVDAVQFLFRDNMVKTTGTLINEPVDNPDDFVDDIEIEFVLFHPDDWDKLMKEIAAISPESAGKLLLTENKKRL